MAHQPTLKQLKYLCAVAETKHFGNAAKACHVSQPTLSAGIHELEEHLGVTLIERTNKQVLITPLGHEIAKRSRDVLTDVEDLMSMCDASREPFSGELRMGVIPTIAPFVLPKLLNKLRRLHPDFKLFIREQLSGKLVEGLMHGDLDVLLLALPYPAENVETLHLFYDDFLLAYPEGRALDISHDLRTEDLKGLELLLLEDGHCLRDHALDACHLRDAEISIPYEATSLNTIVQMVANGIGVTLLPKMALDAKILSGTNVKTRAFTEAGVRRSIGLMWRKRCPRTEEFRLLSEFICDQMDPGAVK